MEIRRPLVSRGLLSYRYVTSRATLFVGFVGFLRLTNVALWSFDERIGCLMRVVSASFPCAYEEPFQSENIRSTSADASGFKIITFFNVDVLVPQVWY